MEKVFVELKTLKMNPNSMKKYAIALKKFVKFLKKFYKVFHNLNKMRKRCIKFLKKIIMDLKNEEKTWMKEKKLKNLENFEKYSEKNWKKIQNIFNSKKFLDARKLAFDLSENCQRLLKLKSLIVDRNMKSVPELSKSYEFLVQTIAAIPALKFGQRSGNIENLRISEWKSAQIVKDKISGLQLKIIYIQNHKTSERFVASIVLNPEDDKIFQVSK